MAATTSSRKLAWERFEELAKVAFVADPHADTRFFFKTRVVSRASSGGNANKSNSNKKSANGAGVKIVVRVSTRPRKKSGSAGSGAGAARVAAQSITYQTSLVSNLARLTRLLRFVMQEVLGPMKPVAAVSAPLSASSSSGSGGGGTSTTPATPPPSDTSTSTKPKTSKSGNKKKK